ncbi:MAG: hypothetical protein QM706_15180 [Nitrospira sp.]
METFRERLSQVVVVACVLFPLPSIAETVQVPWECSNYTGDAQTRCVHALLEAQQKKIAELEGKLQFQEGTVSQLKSQLDRQSTATADLQRQLAERPSTSIVPIPYSYPYSYGYGYGYPLGLGLGFGLELWKFWDVCVTLLSSLLGSSTLRLLGSSLVTFPE